MIKNLKIEMKEFLITYITLLVAFYSPIAGLAISILLVIGLDTILGIWKCVKNNGWSSFSSRKFSGIVSKTVLYLLSVYLLFPIDYYILNDIVSSLFLVNVKFLATKILVLSLIFIEIKSIDENLKEMNIDIWSNIKKILARAKEVKNEVDELE